MEPQCPGGEKMKYLAGIDIGGTKCSVSLGRAQGGQVELLCRERFPTPGTPGEAVERMKDSLGRLLSSAPQNGLSAVGVSCGGPLSSERGLILSPPNLPGWDGIDILTPFEEAFGVPAFLENDANACALAEWLWGAGKGTRNMVFLTFGTGLGAGLILDGHLYRGACDMAGEAGHIRLSETGPVGFGKAGSFEGFCSGGGIGRMGRALAEERGLGEERRELFSTAAGIAEAADQGDELALEIFQRTGRMLGLGLSMLMDILNPELIVIGSIFLRQEKRLRTPMEKVLKREALPLSLASCRVVPAGLGEELGDYGALSAALNGLREKKKNGYREE